MRTKSGAVNMARRQRRALKNAAKVARMERRIQTSAQSPFTALADIRSESTEAAHTDPMERLRSLARSFTSSADQAADPESSATATHEETPNLSLAETPADALDRFADALQRTNTFVMPSFGIDNPAARLVIAHILKHISTKHATQQRANEQLQRGEDIVSTDSGFTNTSVLVVLPSRCLAKRFIEDLGAHFDSIDKLEQFSKDFGLQTEEDPKLTRKPADHQALFTGNVDDKFCIGLRVNASKLLLYSEYKQADILVASPLGLSYYLGISDGPDDGQSPNEKAFLLASVEILFAPMLEVLLMQNWGRLKAVLSRVNAPVELRDTSELGDFTRLKPQFAEGTSGRHRQNILTALFPHPYFAALFRSLCAESVLPTAERIDESAAGQSALSALKCRVRQYFLRLPVASGLGESHADRLRYFTDKLYPTRLSYYFASRTPMLIIVPTYYQYVAVRAFFEENLTESYSDLCEYTSDTDRRRALKNFNSRQVHVLLTTERYYFYKRRAIKGAVLLVWYAPPMFPQFYVEIVHALDTQDEASAVLMLFSKYDVHALRRVVGDERARVFLQSGVEDDVFCVH